MPKRSQNYANTTQQNATTIKKHYPTTIPKQHQNDTKTMPKLSQNYQNTVTKLSKNCPETTKKELSHTDPQNYLNTIPKLFKMRSCLCGQCAQLLVRAMATNGGILHSSPGGSMM